MGIGTLVVELLAFLDLDVLLDLGDLIDDFLSILLATDDSIFVDVLGVHLGELTLIFPDLAHRAVGGVGDQGGVGD